MLKVSRMLVPVDGSECSRAALKYALSLASQLGAAIDVLYVAELPSLFGAEPRIATGGGPKTLREYAVEVGQAELDAFLGKLEPGERSKLTTAIEAGIPRDRILERAASGQCDLVVMGTHGRTGRAHSFAGSVAESVVRSASCPVLTVRAPG